VENEKRIIPAGLNRAIEAARGEYIVRLDGHSMPRPDYVARCVSALKQDLGDNVGGVWEIQPRGNGWQARAIAAAAAHPLGVGDAKYRYTDRAGEVDTVPFGAFRANLVQKIGSFDETLLTNEDYEFNTRIRQSGGRVWLDPAIRSVYFAAPNFTALARQYWRYGYWKARMLRRYPQTVRWRQALPPLFVVGLVTLMVVGFFWPAAHILAAGVLLVYTLILIGVGVQQAIYRRDLALAAGVPAAIAVMHLTWGSALAWSWFKPNG
jgi:GT2 family glycosyltransferase